MTYREDESRIREYGVVRDETPIPEPRTGKILRAAGA
jgi:hypothetical protein